MAERTELRRPRKRTCSALGDATGKPSGYEIVTHNMNHTTGETPLEMGPEVHGNVWLEKYRDGISIEVENGGCLPRSGPGHLRQLRGKMQDEQEAYIDKLLASFSGEDTSDGRFSNECLQLGITAMTVCRYLAHVSAGAVGAT